MLIWRQALNSLHRHCVAITLYRVPLESCPTVRNVLLILKRWKLGQKQKNKNETDQIYMLWFTVAASSVLLHSPSFCHGEPSS